MGSFSDTDYDAFLATLLQGLLSLKSQGATQLIIDVVCKSTIALWSRLEADMNRAIMGAGMFVLLM